MTYSPEGLDSLTFLDVMPRFRDGSDTPRAYLERCLAVIADRGNGRESLGRPQPVGRARGSAERYRRGRPISSIDGTPIGIKDLLIAAIAPAVAHAAETDGRDVEAGAAEFRIFRCYCANRLLEYCCAIHQPRQNHFSLSTTLSSGCPVAKRRQFSIRIASHFSRYGVP